MKVIHKDATIHNVGSDEDFPGSFEVILSAPTLDRDGDTLLAEDWKMPLPDHITFDMDHGMSVATTIGSGRPELLADGRLKVNGTYTSLDRGQEQRTLVKEGHIKTTSVAFMTEKSLDAEGKTVIKRELLNGAFVAIPSNREALVLGSKSGARNSTGDASKIQAIHDHAAGLGANCSDAKSFATKAATLEDARTILADLDLTDLPAEIQSAITLIQSDEHPVDDAETAAEDEAAAAAPDAAAAAESETAADADTEAVEAKSLEERAALVAQYVKFI